MAKISEGFITLHLIKDFFDCSYYLCFIPFRLKLDQHANTYSIISNCFQKGLCLALHFYTAYFMMIQVPRIYGFVQCFDNFTVGQLFACATWAGSFLFFLMYIRLMWTRQKALLKLASATTVKFFVRYPAQKRFLYNVFKCLLAIHMLSAIYIDYLFVLGSVETSENPKKLSSQLRKSWHTRLCVIASDYKLNFLISMNTFFFVLVLALYFVRIEIERSILQQPFDVGVCILDALRKRIDYVNEAVGDMLLAFYLATVSHYCEYPEVIGTNYYKEHSYSVLIFFIGTGITWIMGAHFHHNITRLFIKWAQAQLSGTKHPQLVNKYVNTSSNLQMTVLSMLPEAMVSRRDIILFKRTAICNDLALEPIALSCSLFSVTNGLVCSIAGLLLTYSVIILQTRKPQQPVWGES